MIEGWVCFIGIRKKLDVLIVLFCFIFDKKGKEKYDEILFFVGLYLEMISEKIMMEYNNFKLLGLFG